eukprot:s1049_g36.t1
MVVDGVGATGRLYCPVTGCPSADPSRAPGWTSQATLFSHIDSHLAGTLQGTAPAQWFQDHRRQRCSVCGLSVSTRYGIHPTCQPAARAALGASGPARPASDALGLPTLDEVQATRDRTLRHVPAAARFLWGQVLNRAVAATAHHKDLKAWTELLMLPQCVLGAPLGLAVATAVLRLPTRWTAFGVGLKGSDAAFGTTGTNLALGTGSP